jgi:hypothetical protein
MKNGQIKEEDVVKIAITAERVIDLEEVYKLEKLIEKKKRMRSN